MEQTKDLTPLQQEINTQVVKSTSLVIDSVEKLTEAQQVLLTINTTVKKVKEEHDPLCQAANETHKLATALRAKYLKPLENAKNVIASRMGEYQRKVQLVIDEKNRKAKEKAEQEERDRQKELKTENDEKVLKKAVHCEAMGDMESIEDILNTPLPVREEPLLVPETISDAPTAKGLSYRENWHWEIENISLIPDEYKIIDEKAVNAVVKALKDRCNIPGIKVFSSSKAVQRTK